METAWIQVFVLSLTQCIAPAGKMVCQEEVVEYQFATRGDCDRARVQLIDLATRSDNVIVDGERSVCRTAVRESTVFASADDARSTLGGDEDMVLVDGGRSEPDFTRSAHTARLENTRTCEETGGIAPCKIGEIILEAAEESDSSQVWRRQN